MEHGVHMAFYDAEQLGRWLSAEVGLSHPQMEPIMRQGGEIAWKPGSGSATAVVPLGVLKPPSVRSPRYSHRQRPLLHGS